MLAFHITKAAPASGKEAGGKTTDGPDVDLKRLEATVRGIEWRIKDMKRYRLGEGDKPDGIRIGEYRNGYLSKMRSSGVQPIDDNWGDWPEDLNAFQKLVDFILPGKQYSLTQYEKLVGFYLAIIDFYQERGFLKGKRIVDEAQEFNIMVSAPRKKTGNSFV